eukprot:s266_g9.t1
MRKGPGKAGKVGHQAGRQCHWTLLDAATKKLKLFVFLAPYMKEWYRHRHWAHGGWFAAGVFLLGGTFGTVQPLLSTPTVWKYEPPKYAHLAVRRAPEQAAKTTGHELKPGEVFEVQGVKEVGKSTFLELADGKGWILAASPVLGKICIPYEGFTLWRFQPPQHRPLDLRAAPTLNAPRTGHRLLPGTRFRCAREVAEGGQRFLELDTGEGWAFDKTLGPAGAIRLCQREQSLHTAKVAEEARPAIPANLLEPPPVAAKTALRRFPVEELFLGQQLTGYVSSISNEGVFVDVGAETEGWVHIAALSDDFVEDPFAAVQIGDEVQAVVTSIMPNRKATTAFPEDVGLTPVPSQDSRSLLYLSMASKTSLRAAGPPPGQSRPQVGSRFDGLVSHVKDIGIHVILGDGRAGLGHEGFLHVSKMAGHVASTHEAFKVGDKLTVQVIGDRGNLELSTKDLGMEDLDRSKWFQAKVYNIKAFGIFVEVMESPGAGTQGMVHLSQIREGYVKNIYDEVEIGEVVKVRVLSKESGRVKFTMLPE